MNKNGPLISIRRLSWLIVARTTTFMFYHPSTVIAWSMVLLRFARFDQFHSIFLERKILSEKRTIFFSQNFHFHQNRGTRFSKHFPGFFPFTGIYKLLKIGRVHTIVWATAGITWNGDRTYARVHRPPSNIDFPSRIWQWFGTVEVQGCGTYKSSQGSSRVNRNACFMVERKEMMTRGGSATDSRRIRNERLVYGSCLRK